MYDIQLITGSGILLSGYIRVSCTSAYHWQLLVYLAWFSNLTHIACLTALRRYLYQHQSERNWRLVLMAVLWAALIPAMVPAVFFNWLNLGEPTASFPSSNARCFFDVNTARSLFNNATCFRGPDVDGEPAECVQIGVRDTAALQSATVSILLLGCSFFSRSIKLTKRLSDGVRVKITLRDQRSLHQIPGQAHQRNCHKPAVVHRESTPARPISGQALERVVVLGSQGLRRTPSVGCIRRTFLFMALCDRIAVDISHQFLTDSSCGQQVYWLVVSAAWGTLRLAQAKLSVEVDDNEWSFGQILPVFLLIGPLVTAFEVIAESKSEEGSVS